MATAASLISTASDIIQDSSFSDDDILRALNRGVMEIAGGPLVQDVNALLAPLPDLLVINETVQTVAEVAHTSMPATFHRVLRRVVSETSGRPVHIETSFEQFSDRSPRLNDTGSDVARVLLSGTQLYYQPIPTAPVTLLLSFYRKPVAMSADEEAEQTTPDGIPEHLQEALLINFAARELFSIIDGDDGLLAYTTAKHDQMYRKALVDLYRYIGPINTPPYNIAGD